MLWILTVAFICVVGLYIYGLYLQGAEHTKNLNYQETLRRKYAGKENLNIFDLDMKERAAFMGYNSIQELYDNFPTYLTEDEIRMLYSKHALRIDDYDKQWTINNGIGTSALPKNYGDDFIINSLDERMRKLGVHDYTTLCRDYSEYVTPDEFQYLLAKGLINSVDDIIEFKGNHYENEFSEEWEEFEYEWDKKHK